MCLGKSAILICSDLYVTPDSNDTQLPSMELCCDVWQWPFSTLPWFKVLRYNYRTGAFKEEKIGTIQPEHWREYYYGFFISLLDQPEYCFKQVNPDFLQIGTGPFFIATCVDIIQI